MGSFAPKGHARVDPQRPAAFAICDCCGFMYNHRDLRWGMQWHGRNLRRTGFLVCPKCWDVPNPTLRPIVLPPDPVPILNPRPDQEHCHVFRPRADQLREALDGFPNSVTADTAFRIWPPVDDTTPDPVTVDIGDVCDTRSYVDGWSVPLPGPITPIIPPIYPPDATTDNDTITADSGATTDASPIFPPVEVEQNTADTTLVLADNGIKLTNVFPDYLYAADMTTTKADTMFVSADSQTD